MQADLMSLDKRSKLAKQKSKQFSFGDNVQRMQSVVSTTTQSNNNVPSFMQGIGGSVGRNQQTRILSTDTI